MGKNLLLKVGGRIRSMLQSRAPPWKALHDPESVKLWRHPAHDPHVLAPRVPLHYPHVFPGEPWKVGVGTVLSLVLWTNLTT